MCLKEEIPRSNVNIDIKTIPPWEKDSIRNKPLQYFDAHKNYSHDKTSLLIKLQKLKGNLKSFENTNYATLLLEDKHNNILEKCNKIWDNVKFLNKKDLDAKQI